MGPYAWPTRAVAVSPAKGQLERGYDCLLSAFYAFVRGFCVCPLYRVEHCAKGLRVVCLPSYRLSLIAARNWFLSMYLSRQQPFSSLSFCLSVCEWVCACAHNYKATFDFMPCNLFARLLSVEDGSLIHVCKLEAKFAVDSMACGSGNVASGMFSLQLDMHNSNKQTHRIYIRTRTQPVGL